MSLLAQLHDLKLSLSQFRLGDISPEEEQRIAHTAAKLVAMLDQVSSRTAPADPSHHDDEEAETLLSIARQYGVRVQDLRKHNAHLQHFDDVEPLPKNTPVKIKGSSKKHRGASQHAAESAYGGSEPRHRVATPAAQLQLSYGHDPALAGPQGGFHSAGARVVFDTIRNIARDQNVSMDALIAANRVLQRFDIDEPLPQDLDIVIPTTAPPNQRTYVLTFAGESVRTIADSVAHCRPEDLLIVNPQLGNIGLDTRLPEGTRIALPR